jgi:chromosome segregation ATPase
MWQHNNLKPNHQVNELKLKKPSSLAGSGVAEVEKIRNQLTKLEKENEALKAGGMRLRSRTPKKPTDLTTKLQLKKMVDELEEEVAELLVGLNKAQDSKTDTTPKVCYIVNLNISIKYLYFVLSILQVSEAVTKELEEVKKERDKLKKVMEMEKTNFSTEKSKTETDLKKAMAEKTKIQGDLSKLQAENKKTKEELDKLKSSQGIS